MKFLLISLSLSGLLLASEKPVKMKDLPPAVQKTVSEQIKPAELKGLTKETENGQTMYEAETRVNGKTRDILIDASGAVVEVEEETTLDAIPAPARTAIESATAGGKINKVEKITKGSDIAYEAAYKKDGKKSEIKVGPDGAVRK